MSCLHLLFLVSAFGFAGKTEDVAQDDLRLEGSWQPVSAEMGGMPLPGGDFDQAVLIFADGKMTSKQADRTINTYSYRVNVAKKPATIDLEGLTGGDKGKKQIGIYDISGDVLKFCVSVSGDERPTSWQSETGKDWILITLKRKK